MTYASQDITIRLCILFFSNVYKNKIDILVTIVCIEWLLVDNPICYNFVLKMVLS